ncbi:Cd2+/Zn2+-exporting ATPase [Bacillus ectoiniformans]|uniref:heavy metal translocating P-type ATPase n=1 Tax=Bacillus ectoiniformans TaxID=1494429 RepID=UPI00195C8825|nr:cation-translocating P-type ATPase [Bacillus ectoiniformans]MBM7650139.1 Cd2+/Zn2+-exporting ATPase [Bacillus ectoiniformans]
MADYRLKGLSCANCARELEEAIQKLPNGEEAKIYFNTSKLSVPDQVDMQNVTRILAADGASLVLEDGQEEIGEQAAQRMPNWKLSLLISVLLFSIGLIAEGSIPGAAVFIIYLAAAGISGYHTFLKGLKNLARFKFTIDTLMTVALIGAFSIGEWREGTLVAILFGLNEYLEGLGMEKARRSMESLLKVAPKEAVRLENGQEHVVPIASLRAGDYVLVKSGEKIPSDGKVIKGHSSVNEAAITGESMPVDKLEGEKVFGGSVNNEGVLVIEIEKAYQDSSLAKILHLVEEAQETKTPTELFINQFAKYYTPAVMMISVIVMVGPPLVAGGLWSEWFYQGLAVLIVGCPCALILSSPIAIVSGITRNARNGILIKGGVYLEQLGQIETIAFDKTGTLTKGKPNVEKTYVYYPDLFYKVAGAIEKNSSHPLARAVLDEVSQKESHLPEAEDITTIPGQGVKARVFNQMYYIGNESGLESLLLSQSAKDDMASLKESGYTLVAVSSDKEVLGLFGIRDEIRPESKELISKLNKARVKSTVMLTGDHEKTAEKVAESIGLTHYYAGLLPDEKVEKVRELSRLSKTAMVGDGINDAPALATADLGIAMGKGTDSAIETADIVLMQDHLGKLPEAISISRQVNKIIKFNIAFALGIKIFALLLTIPGWLTLWIAILSDMGATIIVTLISLTVLIEKKQEKNSVH